MKNEIHQHWTSVIVPHNPSGQNYIRCMHCGEIWLSDEAPEKCPHCHVNMVENKSQHSVLLKKRWWYGYEAVIRQATSVTASSFYQTRGMDDKHQKRKTCILAKRNIRKKIGQPLGYPIFIR